MLNLKFFKKILSFNRRSNFQFIQKFSYNKRILPSWQQLNEKYKMLEDEFRMIDYSEFTDAALVLQSDLFHESLFESLRGAIKKDKEMSNKMKEMALRMGLPKDTLKDKYSNSFNEYLKLFLIYLQDEIKARTTEDPSLLETSPEWEKKLENADGFLEYLDNFKIEMSEEKFGKYPEINKMILNLKPEEFVQNFSQLYLNGVINEDKMRLEPHVNSMKDYLTHFEKDIEETRTINNEMWVTKLKQDTFNYIKTVLNPEFQKQSVSYAKTNDNMRIDIGLVISRPPIFLTTTHEDMEFGKYRRKTLKKYVYNIDKHLQEVDSFNDVTSDFWDVCASQFRVNNDNKPNIRKWNPEKNEFDFYASNSKHWTLVDPDIKDNKSIQYAPNNRTYMLFKNKKTGEFEFPSIPMYNGDTFDQSKYRLFFYICQEQFKIVYATPYPHFMITRDFHDHEKEDPKNKGYTGVRTFYLQGFHYRNTPIVTPNSKHPYNDFIFIPKYELSKYVGENYWNGVISNLQEK